MSTAGHTPNFIAEEAIYPFRCVKVGTAPFKAVPSTANPEILLGVTDGSIQTFNGTYHATAGQTISLQNGEFVQLTASGSITVGDTLIATTDGKVEAGVSATEYIAQAAENANDGEIFWAKKIGAWTVSGGGPSPIGGGWPAPESKALWQCEFTGAIPRFIHDPNYDPLTCFAPGPDYYFDTNDANLSLIEMNYSAVENRMGVVDVSSPVFINSSAWIRVGNAPTANLSYWENSSIGGRPGVDIRFNNNEFLNIWKPYSYLSVPGGVAWSMIAGCCAGSSSYPLEPSGVVPCFLFVASNANANWICRARFEGPGPAFAPVDYDFNTGIALNTSSPVWRNMKIVTVPGSGATPYPTIEYYIDGTLVHSFDVNTATASEKAQLDGNPMFTVMGHYVAANAATRWLTSQLDYQHSATTFTNPR